MTQRGINPKDAVGAKKPNLSLVPPAAIVGIAQCMENGAVKYGPYNWRNPDKPPQMTVYIAAAMRHLLALLDGEDCASDSGRHHAAHAMAGLAVMYDALCCGNLIDDRPATGAAAALIEEHQNDEE